MKVLPDERFHRLSVQRKMFQHNINIPRIFGEGAPSFRKRFSQKVLPLSQHASGVDTFLRWPVLECFSSTHRFPLEKLLSANLYSGSICVHVCVLHINRSFYPSTSSTPSVRADSSSQRDTQYTTGGKSYNFFCTCLVQLLMCIVDYFFHLRLLINCLLYTSPSPRDKRQSRMPSSA